MNFINGAIQGVTWTTAATAAGACFSLAAIFDTAALFHERARWRRCAYGAHALKISEVCSRGHSFPLEEARETIGVVIGKLKVLYPSDPAEKKGFISEGNRPQEIQSLERDLKKADTVGDLRHVIERLESLLGKWQSVDFQGLIKSLETPKKTCSMELGNPLPVFIRDIGNGGRSLALTSYTSRFKREGVISFYQEEFGLGGAALVAFGLAALLKQQYRIPLWNGPVIAS